MSFKERKIFIITIVLSLLFHLFFILFFKYEFLFGVPELAAKEPEPIVLEFEQPAAPPPEAQEKVAEKEKPRKFYEIVENPNASGDTPENADMISTENSLAQSPEKSEAPQQEIPGSEVEKLQQQLKNNGIAKKESKAPTPESDPDGLLAYRQPVFTREALQKHEEESKNEQSSPGESPRDIQHFKADLIGGIALNTYAWPYAGFLLKFKRKLFRVWTIPSAYTYLGLISGYTIVQAHISREGVLTRLDVLEHVGHESLKTASLNALDATFPLVPLPADFPEKELVLTIKMIYPDLRQFQKVN